ncbi:MAG: toll/interleukin-1 receptor domain-containing protein [Chloroflexi bacterium]|uniref:toll/interleukin-1 receptor domain-containing protein n=1 Tax=Candidatus Flexifilum breve TaxID=3140694 RepID=UPI003134A22C|nr:toll/interleukin-1 receptor domain-containing protein [Chloroflexota bacterium]
MDIQPHVFISYSRKDGADFAAKLRSKLEVAGVPVDQDHVLLEGGSDWWLQLEAAIKRARFLVLLMTPAAMRSEFVKKEWRLARQEGVCVYPVKAGSKTDFDSLIGTLPRWMRDMHFYDLGYDPDALRTRR